MSQRGAPPKPFIAHSPDGETLKVRGISPFARKHGLNATLISNVLNGRAKSTGGWRFEPAPDDADLSEYETVVCDPEPKPEPQPESGPEGRSAMPSDAEITARAPEMFEEIRKADDRTPEQKIRDMYDLVIQVTMGVLRGSEPPAHWKLEQVRRVIADYAKSNGINPDSMADHRTDEQLFSESAMKLMRMGPSAMLEMFDEELEAIERNMDLSDEHTAEFVESLGGMRADELVRDPGTLPPGVDPGGPPGPKVIRAAAKQWVDRVRRVREVARRARDRCDFEAPEAVRRKQAMAHLLRFHVYTARSGRSESSSPAESVFTVGMIHAKVAASMYMARGGYKLTPEGITCPGDMYDERGTRVVAHSQHWAGIGVMLPPRHGKTALSISDMAMTVNEYNRIQMAVVHDNETEAERILSDVKKYFRTDTDTGRRNYRLFPYEMAAYDNDKSSLRLKQRDPPKNPNLLAASVWSSRLGGDLHRCYGDDIVPASDKREPTRRTARFHAYHTTWGSRDMGANAYFTLLGYPHHHHDLMYQTYNEARKWADSRGREGVPWIFVRIPVGGPKATDTMPAFKPILPELYPEKWLRAKYRSSQDRFTWAANYQLDPMPDDMRIVDKLGFYEAGSSASERALDRGEHHLSIDPTSTDRSTSDKVGMVQACVTDLEYQSGDGEMARRRVVMLTGEDEFLSTQPALVEKIMEMSDSRSMSRSFNYTHIETQGIGQPLVDFMESQYGFDNVIQHTTPGSLGKKEARFRAFAGLLDNSDPENSPAKVLLPGRRPVDENGDPIPNAPLEPLSGWDRIANYILNFKSETGFHSLDALIQLIRWCHDTGRVEMGHGGPSRRNREPAVPEGVDRRKMKYYAEESKRGSRRGRRHGPGGRTMGATSGV